MASRNEESEVRAMADALRRLIEFADAEHEHLLAAKLADAEVHFAERFGRSQG